MHTDATNRNCGPFAGVGREFALDEAQALPENGSIVSLADEAEANVHRGGERPDSPERVSAVFSSFQENFHLRPAQGQGGCNALGLNAEEEEVAPLHRERTRFFSEASQSSSSPPKKQKTSKAARRAPQAATVRIFGTPELQGRIALSTVCNPVLSATQACYQQRCSQLRAADAAHHWFERFGIECPDGAGPTAAQLKAMIARVRIIIGSMKSVLSNFQEISLPKYTAEAWLLRAPAVEFQPILELAYQCNVYTAFSRLANVPSAITLGEAKERIRAWLASDGAPNILELSLERLGLTCLPVEIGNLVNLQKLGLSSNQLESLPDAIGNLVNLQTLLVSGNQLESLPEAIGKLVNLQTFLLGKNQLKSLPDAIWNLASLQELGLSSTQLKSLPEAIGKLVNLQKLGLANNQLNAVPDAIGNLVNLETLVLEGNRLNSLPEAIGKLVNLRKLGLANNQLNSVPDAIGNLVNLETLVLEDNRLNLLPDAIGNLVKLRELCLGNNQLNSLPATVGCLPKLYRLELYNNRFITLPPDVWQFEGMPYGAVGQRTFEALRASMARTRLLMGVLRSESQQSLALEQSLNNSQQGRAIREPLYTQRQQLGTLQGQRAMLRQRQARLLLGQAKADLSLAQKTFWQGQQQLDISARDEAETLAPFRALVADLAQLTTISGGLLQQLANCPGLDPQEAQAWIDMIRCSLQQKQAKIGSLHAPRPKREVSIERDLAWCTQMLALHLAQLTTLIGELLPTGGESISAKAAQLFCPTL